MGALLMRKYVRRTDYGVTRTGGFRLTLSERRERNLLRAVVSRCEGYFDMFGPLWEPERIRPHIDLEEAVAALLDIESRLAEMLDEERLVALRYFRGASLFIFVLASVLVALGGGAEVFLVFGLMWAIVAGLWLTGRPLEIQGYWLSRTSAAFPDGARLVGYRAVFEELFDVWAGVDQSAATELRVRMQDADARRVLIVLERAWSLRSLDRRTIAV